MATKKQKMPADSDEVTEFMRTFEHPLKAEIEAVRALILDADTSIGEGIKWNAPSFCVQEYFATIHIKNTKAVQIILHLGAKARASKDFTIEDPNGLLEWLGKDRASVKFNELETIHANAAAFSSIVSQWIKHL